MIARDEKRTSARSMRSGSPSCRIKAEFDFLCRRRRHGGVPRRTASMAWRASRMSKRQSGSFAISGIFSGCTIFCSDRALVPPAARPAAATAHQSTPSLTSFASASRKSCDTPSCRAIRRSAGTSSPASVLCSSISARTREATRSTQRWASQSRNHPC